jgi:saccharopine dehydrogenase-like NADP-dependent oxidoreductase
MHHVMVVGAGKIGSLIACLLADSQRFQVHLADVAFSGLDVSRLLQVMPDIKTVALDVKEQGAISAYIQKHSITAVISSLPYFLNSYVAQAAKAQAAHYFDLTEDTSITAVVKAIAADATTAFVPQCGLAPGFISIVANSLMQEFEECHRAQLRVGALPQRSSHSLHYSLTWSTDGLINEYGNPCHAIEKGTDVLVAPLEGLELIQMDGCEYEAFNTSGGLGSLGETYRGRVQYLNYKTLRYPGHCEKIRFLMNDLKLNENREILKQILEKALPKTYQDMVLVYVSIEGMMDGVFTEKSYIKKIYPHTICNMEWSAIQVSTAAGVCSVVDLVLSQKKQYSGLVLQEYFSLSDVLSNAFGRYFI